MAYLHWQFSQIAIQVGACISNGIPYQSMEYNNISMLHHHGSYGMDEWLHHKDNCGTYFLIHAQITDMLC